jgi:NAD(P)H-flavin reductase
MSSSAMRILTHADHKGDVTFIIKRYKDGPMSEHMHNMEVGQRLDIKGPIPKYQWTANKQSVYAHSSCLRFSNPITASTSP